MKEQRRFNSGPAADKARRESAHDAAKTERSNFKQGRIPAPKAPTKRGR